MRSTPLGDTLNAQGRSQKSLIADLAAIGHEVRQQSVSAWVRGEYRPRPIHQAAVAHVLGVPMHLLFPPPPLVIERPREDAAA